MTHVFGKRRPSEEQMILDGQEGVLDARCHLSDGNPKWANMDADFNCNPSDIDPCQQDLCGTAQVEAFKAMVNEGNARYIFGKIPPLPRSLSDAYKINRNAGSDAEKKPWVGWDEGGMNWELPPDRIN